MFLMTPKEYFDKGMVDLKKFDGFKLQELMKLILTVLKV